MGCPLVSDRNGVRIKADEKKVKRRLDVRSCGTIIGVALQHLTVKRSLELEY